ncbi:MAG: secretin N-terminal domain-containing protein [Pseudomonadota bacterium]
MSSPLHIWRARRAGRSRGALSGLALPLLALALSGCAAQMSFRDGNSLVKNENVEEALLKYRDAIEREPGNAEYRAAYLAARDRAISRYQDQAGRYLNKGQPELALPLLQRVLRLDPQNDKAKAWVRTLEQGKRHDLMLAEAAAAIEAKQYDPARQRLNAVLTERPGYEPARVMLRDLNDKLAPPPVEGGLARAYKQPITIEFRDAPLKQVFEVIARRSGLNFVFDKDVKTDTRASISLKNSTVESAIYFMLMTNQLEQQVMDANTILVYPNVAAKLKEYQEMVVKTFYLANADAKLVANTLKTILKSRDVVVDEKLNLLIVRDSPEAIRLAERLVALQDVAEPEVMLEVEIMEIKRSRLLELGISWPSDVSLTPLTTSTGGGVTLADLQNLNKGTIGISGIGARFKANKTDGDANLLANPRIRVRNKEKAKIVIGDKVPVISSNNIPSGSSTISSETISYVDVGLTLNAEPTIYLNSEVAIRISLEVSNLVREIATKSGSVAYQIGTRQASTMLQLKDGENQVLAGLINSEDRSDGSKVPGLGEMPLLGRLFGITKDDRQKTEIVLSITPRLVRNVQRPDAAASEFTAGTETSFRRRPDLNAKGVAELPGPVRPGQVMSGGSGSTSAPTGQLRQQQVPDVGAAPQAVPNPQTDPSPLPPAPFDNSSQKTAPPAGGIPLSSSQPVPVQPIAPPPTTAPAPAPMPFPVPGLPPSK